MNWQRAQHLDELGYKSSPFHTVDSRAKILLTIFFIICVISLPKYEIARIIPFALIPVIWAIFGQVPWRLIRNFILSALPLALVMTILNPLIDSTPVFFLDEFSIARGWFSLFSLLIKISLTVSLIAVLTATTSLGHLSCGLRQLGVPKIMANQLQFLYRYLFLLIDDGLRVSRARQLRDPLHKHPSLRVAGNMLSFLLWRSIARASRIYHCMLARDFQGELPVTYTPQFKVSDGLFLALGAGWCLFAWFCPISMFFGRLFWHQG